MIRNVLNAIEHILTGLSKHILKNVIQDKRKMQLQVEQ